MGGVVVRAKKQSTNSEAKSRIIDELKLTGWLSFFLRKTKTKNRI